MKRLQLSDAGELEEVFGRPVCHLAGGHRLALHRGEDLDLPEVGVASLLMVRLHRDLKVEQRETKNERIQESFFYLIRL